MPPPTASRTAPLVPKILVLGDLRSQVVGVTRVLGGKSLVLAIGGVALQWSVIRRILLLCRDDRRDTLEKAFTLPVQRADIDQQPLHRSKGFLPFSGYGDG